MSRLFAALTLWLLLFAAPPASGMMSVPPENRTWEFFSPTSFEQGGGWLWNQDGTRDAAPCSYDFASDVRDGPNLYAYVKQNPWTAFDPDGLWLKEMLPEWAQPLPVQMIINPLIPVVDHVAHSCDEAGKGYHTSILPRSMNFHFAKNWKFKVSREWSSWVVEFRALRQSSMA